MLPEALHQFSLAISHMLQQNVEALYRRFPICCRSRPTIQCDDGWFEILYRALQILANIAESQPAPPARSWLQRILFPKFTVEYSLDNRFLITKIIEQYGALRIYGDNTTPAIREVIFRAEDRSRKICGVCGEAGHYVKVNNNYKARCQIHNVFSNHQNS